MHVPQSVLATSKVFSPSLGRLLTLWLQLISDRYIHCSVCCSYSQMSEEEVKLDRYAKFRALGQFEEFLVPGGQWRETRASRAKASSC